MLMSAMLLSQTQNYYIKETTSVDALCCPHRVFPYFCFKLTRKIQYNKTTKRR